jgi:hypothetical protein
MWPLIAAGAGMLAQGIGGNQAAESTVTGARTQADIERMNRDFQRQLFDAEMERLQPRYQAGTQRGLPLLGQYLSQGRVDQSQMPLYQMQRGRGLQGLQDEGMDNPFTRSYFTEGLDAAENEAGYSRLGDLLQIALGASGSAGAGAQNFASGLSTSFMNQGNALSRGQAGGDAIRGSMYGNLAGQASGIPAYLSQSNYLRNQR